MLKKVIIEFLKYDNVKVVLFGSRARGDNYISSDVDIGIIPYGKSDKKKFTLLKENVENLNIPYKVEIVDFSEVTESFRRESLKEGIVSNSPKACFKEIFSLGFLNEEETVKCLEMTDRRNDISHTYKEEVAKLIYSKTKGYYILMKNLLGQFEDRIGAKSL